MIVVEIPCNITSSVQLFPLVFCLIMLPLFCGADSRWNIITVFGEFSYYFFFKWDAKMLWRQRMWKLEFISFFTKQLDWTSLPLFLSRTFTVQHWSNITQWPSTIHILVMGLSAECFSLHLPSFANDFHLLTKETDRKKNFRMKEQFLVKEKKKFKRW